MKDLSTKCHASAHKHIILNTYMYIKPRAYTYIAQQDDS